MTFRYNRKIGSEKTVSARIDGETYNRLLMIPEFLREGSAVSDAFSPDRNVIGARSQETAERAREILGIEPESCVFTTTFSAESVKYLSNAFLATCISFTNEVIASFNEDIDFDVSKVI
jgi:UDPglucose 6-dehydrogenase